MIRHRFFKSENMRDSVPRAVDEELAFHLSTRVDALVAQGWNANDARREAERQFGSVDGVRDSCITLDYQRERSTQRGLLREEVVQDVLHAFRLMRRNYAFALSIIVMLSLGIGANTAIFTLVNAVLLRSLPVANADRLLAVGDPAAISSMVRGDASAQLISYPMYRTLRADNVLGPTLLASGMTPRINVRVNTGQIDAEHPSARFVSDNYFRTLGVTAQLGRVFDGREDNTGEGAPTVVLSFSYWQRRFNGDAQVVGKSININGTGVTIVGVMRADFGGEIVGQVMDLWLPISEQPLVSPQEKLLGDASASWLLLLQRVPPNMTMPQAQASLTTRIRSWLREHNPDAEAKPKVFISSGSRGFSRTREEMAAPLAVLMAGVGLLLLLVCANVANLLLARAVARVREMSVRLALGARRGRLIRQLVTESALLAVFGAIGGVFAAWLGIRLLSVFAATEGPASIVLTLDAPVIVYAAFVALLSVMFFGLTPALRASRVNLSEAMRGTIGWERGNNGLPGLRRIGLNQALVAGQVALSLTLIVSAGLLARDLRQLERADTGIDRMHLLTMEVDASAAGYDSLRLPLLAEALRREALAIPGVAQVSYSESGLFSGRSAGGTISVPGFVARRDEDLNVGLDAVGPDYAHTIGARLVSGRDFSVRDGVGTEPVALVNESFARRFFAGKNAIDATFGWGTSQKRIVGVIADIKENSLSAAPAPHFYLAYAQSIGSGPRPLVLIARSASTNVTQSSAALRNVVHNADHTLEVIRLATVAERMERSLNGERLLMRLALVLGGLSLLLAVIGLYGVMSYAVSRRTSEIGLRMALGANRIAVVRLILFDAMKLVLLGVTIGLPAALGLAQLLGSQLHGVGATDAISVGGALVVLSVSAALAAMVPAVRASRLAPLLAIGEGR